MDNYILPFQSVLIELGPFLAVGAGLIYLGVAFAIDLGVRSLAPENEAFALATGGKAFFIMLLLNVIAAFVTVIFYGRDAVFFTQAMLWIAPISVYLHLILLPVDILFFIWGAIGRLFERRRALKAASE